MVQSLGDDLTGGHFAVWDLGFKPNTDDMRKSTSIDVVQHLLAPDIGAVADFDSNVAKIKVLFPLHDRQGCPQASRYSFITGRSCPVLEIDSQMIRCKVATDTKVVLH
jgi:UDP-glucose 6-dehydrogenase